MLYTIGVGDSMAFSDSVAVSITRSPYAISNLITFLVFLSLVSIFQYFMFKFLENLPKIKKFKIFKSVEGTNLIIVILVIILTCILTNIPKMNSLINTFFQNWLDVSKLYFNLNIQHCFLFFFITFIIFIPRFLIKLIETYKQNNTFINIYYIVLIVLFFIVAFCMFKYAIHEEVNNYLEPIIKWFNLEY